METKTSSASAESAYGNKIEPFDYNFEHVVYAGLDEVRAKGEYPSDKEILGFVNAREKANSRAKEFQAQLEKRGIKKPTLEDNVDLQISTIVKVLMASGKVKDEAAAKQQAMAMLGIEEVTA